MQPSNQGGSTRFECESQQGAHPDRQRNQGRLNGPQMKQAEKSHEWVPPTKTTLEQKMGFCSDMRNATERMLQEQKLFWTNGPNLARSLTF